MVRIGKGEEVGERTFGFGGLSGGSGWVVKIGVEMGSGIILGSGSRGIGPKRDGNGWIK